MKHSANYLDRERLESIFSQSESKQVKKSKFFSAMNRIWQHLLTTLTKDINELQVWQTSDRFGNTWWNAYEPTTGRSISLASEAEMRAWIDERYYRR